MYSIRFGVFETNSSSQHSMCIAFDGQKNYEVPEEVEFSLNQIENNHDIYYGEYEKAEYFWSALFEQTTWIHDVTELEDAFKKIIINIAKQLNAAGVKSARFQLCESMAEWIDYSIKNNGIDEPMHMTKTRAKGIFKRVFDAARIEVPDIELKYNLVEQEPSVDHCGETEDFCYGILDHNLLAALLFDPRSYIITGYDGDDVNINENYAHFEYYKGN